MRCALFQINTDLLVIYQNINISTQQTLTLSFISKNKLALLIANFFRNIQFLPHFPLLLTVNEICNISNEYCLFDKSAKEIFNTRDFAPFLRFKKKCALHFRSFYKHPLFPHFYQFSRRMRCVIFQISTNILLIYEDINIFTQEIL